MTSVAHVGRIIGIWETDSVDDEAIEKDRPILDGLLAELHPSVQHISITVTVYGRRWSFRQIGPRYILFGIDP